LKGGDHGHDSNPQKWKKKKKANPRSGLEEEEGCYTRTQKWKKKGVTRVAHAATLQLNPAMEGYSQYEKGNHQDKPHPEVGRRRRRGYTGRSSSYAATKPRSGFLKKKGLHGSLHQGCRTQKWVKKKKGLHGSLKQLRCN
jgi:hypothetical protein